MTDESQDPLKELLDKLSEIPEDVVPRTDSEPLDLTPGSHVTVTWPGDMIEDVDGNVIGMNDDVVNEDMTVTDDGTGMVGWVRTRSVD